MRSSIPSERTDLLEKVDVLSKRLSELIKLPSALSASSVVNQDVSTAILGAIKSRSGLEINYHSLYRDDTSTRIILPIEIVENDGQRYLSSYCHTSSDFRQFRIDRIKSAKLEKVPQEITKSSIQTTGHLSTIKVLTPTREIAERFKQSELSVNSEFHFQSYSLQWIERSIIASGGSVSLLAPAEIRKSISVMAQTMLDRYKSR
jgi:proteasome accessory factor C